MILFHILSASGFPQLGPKMQGFLHFSKKYSKYEWFCDGGNILTASDFDILSVSLLRTIFFEYSKCESVAIIEKVFDLGKLTYGSKQKM